MLPTFVAIDFETADYGRDSACSVGLARVEGGAIVRSAHHLIRPPRKEFVFTYIHGIRWSDVCRKPAFGELWPSLADILDGASFLAAHNASFDRGVLHGCCAEARLAPPELPFVCSMQLARRVLLMKPANLGHVCQRLGIKLKHHDALSDAQACARIILAAHEASARRGGGELF
ncbi:MAG: 3'-5' exonuclease [Elusimicrobia bacterium]|nr:3'-5' exonuclease [Elusimicrobiota bacterium]